MILEHILVYPAGVISAYTHLGEEHTSSPSGEQLLREYRKRLQRSSQVLRTCQQLYVEGHFLLYEENTLQIRTRCGGLNVLDAFMRLPETVEEMTTQLDLLESARSIRDESPGEHDEDADRIVRTYPALKKFRKYSIEVVYCDQEDVFIACRMLRNLLHNKHVTFMPKHHGLSDCDAVDFLEPCAILDCESFTFDDIDDVEHLRAAVTGRTRVLDLFPLWLNFSDNFLSNLPEIREDSFVDRHKQDCEELKQYMLDYDMDAYTEQQQFIMERAIEWNEEWAEGEIAFEIHCFHEKRDTANRAIIAGLKSLYPRFVGMIDW